MKIKKSSEKNNSEKKAFNKNLIQRLAHVNIDVYLLYLFLILAEVTYDTSNYSSV